MKTIQETLLTSGEVHTTSERIASIISDILSTDPFIGKVILLVLNWNREISKAIGRTTDSTIVELLLVKDILRDNKYVSFRDFANAFVRSDDEALRNAAKIITDIIRELGWGMHRLGYAAESSKLTALIDKLETEPAKSAITTLGATALFEGLKTAQADFETTIKQKVDAKTAEDFEKTRICRKALARYLNSLINYIDMMAEIDGGNYQVASDKIDEVLTEVISIARARQTRNADDKTGDDAK